MFLWGLVQIAVSSLLSLILAMAYGHLTPFISAFSLIVGAFAASHCTKAFKGQTSAFRLFYSNGGFDGLLEKVLFVVLALVCIRHFYHLFYFENGNWKTLDIFNYGDLPLHINYIRAMSLGNDFPLKNPIFAQEVLRYPYGIDLYNALWDSLGISLHTHFFWVGLFCSICSLIALRAVASWWGLVGFFLSGGFLGWYSYGMETADKVQWKNLFLTVLVPQRGFLYALPVGLFIIKQMTDKRSKIPALWFGFLWGSLGFFHLHSFFALSLIIGFYALWNSKLLVSLKALLVAVPLGGAFVLFSTDLFRKASIVKVKWGWMYEGPESFWSFIVFNFGPYLFLYILIALLLFKNSWKDKNARSLITPFCLYSALFVLFFNVMLAPWPWDNIKVLIWPYLGLLSVAFLYFQQRMNWKIKSVVAVACAFSGICVVGPTLFSDEKAQVLYSQADIDNAEQATKDLPRSTVFLTTDSHNHVLSYWGRIRFLGYMGHLWTHGINYSREFGLYDRFTKSELEWKPLFQDMKIDYIFYGADMQNLFQNRRQIWQDELKNVSPVPGPSLYKVEN